MVLRVSVMVLMVVIGAASESVAGQAGPDQKRMEPLIGVWKTETEIKTGPSAGKKMTATEQCHWFANWHVVCLTEGSGYSSMRTLSYVADQKQYVSYVVDNSGSATLTLGRLIGDTWTFATDAQGTTRVVMKVGSDAYSLTSESVDAEGKWVPRVVIKAVRQK